MKIRRPDERQRFADPTDVHVSGVLTGISVERSNLRTDFAADLVLPRVAVPKKNDKFVIWTSIGNRKYGTGTSGVGLRRADRAEAARKSLAMSLTEYVTLESRLDVELGDQERGNSDMDLEGAAIRQGTDAVLVDRERRVADLVTNASATNITNNTTLSGTTQWSDYTNSDPLGNLNTATETIRKAAHHEPNRIVMCGSVYKILRRHPALMAFHDMKAGQLSEAQVAACLGFERLVIARATYDTQNEGQATQAGDYIWGDHVLVYYAPPAPSREEPALGYQFVWKDLRVGESYREPSRGVSLYPVWEDTIEKITLATAGYLIKSAVA